LPDSCWTVEYHACVDSTQTLARGRPPWAAVVAGEQTAGRGQATRTFASNPGGLYLTAVLPYAGDARETHGFALAVGWALREALGEAGVSQLRLRWPNDLMIGARKVGGILVEQGGPDTLLIGVGLNVTNCPWTLDTALQSTAGRLVDAVTGDSLPDMRGLASRVLRAIRIAHEAFAGERLAGFVSRLSDCWGPPREVVIDPAGGVSMTGLRGWFRGIDEEGRERIDTATGEVVAIPAHQIGRLREID
jgi:BirA family biotin operon repressor/biotin-[acetyl-CoA-carboxylase] ligase